jgi:hypothetical protein
VRNVPELLQQLGLQQYMPLFEVHDIHSLFVLSMICNEEL